MGYAVLNFTRSNFDNLLAGLFSSQDTLLILDSHMDPVYCSRQEYGEEETGELIASALENWENPGGRDQGFLWEQEEAYGFYFLLFHTLPGLEEFRVFQVGSFQLTPVSVSPVQLPMYRYPAFAFPVR